MSEHGTESRYSNYGCRCAVCRTEHRDWATARRAARLAARVLDANGRWVCANPAVAHGRVSTYANHGCRCAPCSAANTVKSAWYRAQNRRRAERQA